MVEPIPDLPDNVLGFTAKEWIRAAIKIFGLAIPGHVRVFHDRELPQAIQWVSE